MRFVLPRCALTRALGLLPAAPVPAPLPASEPLALLSRTVRFFFSCPDFFWATFWGLGAAEGSPGGLSCGTVVMKSSRLMLLWSRS